MGHERIESVIVALCASRAPDGSICPSEVARTLWPATWREHMNEVREHGLALARKGDIEISQRGIALDPYSKIRGAIRFRLPL